MTAIFAAWVVAILIGVTAEAGGRRGAAAVSAVIP